MRKFQWHRLSGAVPALACIAALTFASATAAAQTSTGSIRGSVTGADSAAVADAQVTARDVETNVQRSAVTTAAGYYFLGGLRPATYELSVRRLGFAAMTRTVRVGIGQTLDENFSLSQAGVQLGTVAVTATPIETRTSEVATNVTTEQIENLPSPSRNFLDLAALAPGVTVSEDRINGTGFRTFSAGGQTANSVNLFIDGASFKNDLTNGGVAGQDASRGNPFPRNAIQEYRVISQNFKAEYQKAGSAIITATTKSGSNTWTGDVLVTYQDQGMVALDTFQLNDREANPASFKRPDYKRTLSAVSVGGPIVKDKAFLFLSYEGNYQTRNNRVTFPTIPSGFPALDTVNLSGYTGAFSSPFSEPLLFGKVTYAINNTSDFEVNVSNRTETDVRDFGANRAFQSAVDFRQNVTVAQAKYNYFTGPWLDETHVDFSRFQRNPRPATQGLAARIYQLPGGDARIGSDFSTQDYRQNRLGLRNDLTYSGFNWQGQHVFKGGVGLDFVQYNILKDNDGTPRFLYREINGPDVYNYETPYQLFYGTGDPTLKTHNNEIGMYVQDDWTPMKQLTLNLGVRWDFETNMINKDYVTPAIMRDTLLRYNDNLPHPLDVSRFLSDGSQRKPFYGAFQPRLGFAYALDQNNRTTVFGGWGLYYDRVTFDLLVDEKLKISHPSFTVNFAPRNATPTGNQVAWSDAYLTADKATLDALVHTSGQPEAWFIPNDLKVPKSTQFNLGVRQLWRDYVGTLTYAGNRGTDQIAMGWAQFGLNTDGSCCVSFDIGAHGFSNFIYASNAVKTWYDAVIVQLERPYQRVTRSEVGWGAGLSWTHANRSVAGTDVIGDPFATFPNPERIAKHASNDEKDRVVGNWIVDLPWIWGVQFSGLATFGGKYRIDVGCAVRFCGSGTTGNQFQRGGFTVPGTFPYRSIDVRLRKDFPINGLKSMSNGRMGVFVDVFNLTNHANFGTNFAVGNRTDANFGQPLAVSSDARRMQLGVEYSF